MNKISFILLLSLASILNISAQDKEAKEIDEFGILACGDMMARMDALFDEYKQNPESEIYVIYYGARYRRKLVDYDKKKKEFSKLELSYPHRDDGLNRAKAIPLYLTTYSGYSENYRNSIKDKIKLIDGGFRENLEIELWLVPKGAELPRPTPLIDEKYIKFRKGKPYPIPKYACCYENC